MGTYCDDFDRGYAHSHGPDLCPSKRAAMASRDGSRGLIPTTDSRKVADSVRDEFVSRHLATCQHPAHLHGPAHDDRLDGVPVDDGTCDDGHAEGSHEASGAIVWKVMVGLIVLALGMIVYGTVSR